MDGETPSAAPVAPPVETPEAARRVRPPLSPEQRERATERKRIARAIAKDKTEKTSAKVERIESRPAENAITKAELTATYDELREELDLVNARLPDTIQMVDPQKAALAICATPIVVRLSRSAVPAAVEKASIWWFVGMAGVGLAVAFGPQIYLAAQTARAQAEREATNATPAA